MNAGGGTESALTGLGNDVSSSATVRTWADGFGRWYAEVPATAGAAHVARAAIKAELSARGELGSAPLYLERAPEYGPNVYREAWDQ